MTEETNRVIKGYELREKIGAGGFGAVYRALQPAVGREVAIKVILKEHANQPEFIRRFETEAQLVARLEHPHIVPLYDYWREPDGAYLVMRFLRGGSLRASIRAGGPWQPESTSLMLDQVAAALTVAHRNGVIHRDLKPDNILLDDEGNAYLADFGIAKDLGRSEGTQQSLIIGSPDYMSPEQVRGEALTPASDIYSFGIVLYETLTGVRPFPDLTATAIMMKQLNDPLPPVSMKRPDLPEEVDDVIAQATEKDPEKRFKDALALAVAFRRAIGLTSALNLTDAMAARQGGGGAAATTEVITEDAERTLMPTPKTPVTAGTSAPVRNPFKGLRAFQSADATDFYGRDALINQLVSRLKADGDTSRFLAVVGPSGSGKSSVVKAGLLPKLRAGAVEGSDRWFIVEMTPGARPYEELEIALLRVAVNPPPSLMEQLQADERGLLRAVSRVLPSADSTLVLVIDQFEEVFTQLENEAVRRQFLTSLLTAIQESRGNLRVIITLRADFYDKPLLYADFGHLFRRCTEVVLPLNREELHEAITKPAQAANLRLEPGLVEAITQDVGEQPGALPLLQYALTELYQRRRGSLLTLEAYREINGAMGALARRAEQTYLELDETCQATARQIFLRLVTLGEGTEDTRRRVRQDELMSLTTDQNAVQAVLDFYGKYRLLTFDRDPLTRVPTVEVAHEALIRSWDRLKGWLNTSRESMRLQRGLSLAAEEWRRNNRDPGYLMSGTRLSQFEEWAAGTDVALSADERAFLESSLAERQRLDAAETARKQREALIARRAQNFGRAAAVLAVVGVLALIATILAFVQASNASQQVATATVAQGLALLDQQTAVAQVATATVAQGQALIEQQAAAEREATANAQVQIVGETLTPVAPTLTAVGATLEAGNAQIATAVFAQNQALNDVATAGANAAAANETLTPIPLTLTAVGAQLASGAIQLETATAAYGEAVAEVAQAQAQVQAVGATLTPVAPTLTAVGATLQAGNALLQTASAAQFQAEALAGTSQAQAIEIAATLTPVAPTLTAVAQQVERGQIRAEALRLVSEGNSQLQGDAGNVELAAMLSIRALNIEYLPLADDVLVAASNRLFTRHLFGDHATTHWYAALSPDSRIAATASDDGVIRLWDVEGGMLLRSIQAPSVAWGLAFSPDGQTILASLSDATAVLFDTATGNRLQTFQGHQGTVFAGAFSSDGARVVTASDDATAIIWDARTGRVIHRLTGHSNTIYGVAFSPDGTRVATASRDTFAALWDANTGELLFGLGGHSNTVFGAAFSPNGRFLLTGSDDNTARLWDVATGRELRALEGHTSGIVSVAFAPDGRTVATASRDRTVRLWDIESRREIRRLSGHTDVVWSVNFSTDGRYVVTASSDGTSRVWDASLAFVPREFIGHEDEVLAVAISPDNRLVATGGNDSTMRLWDRATNTQIAAFPVFGLVRAVDFTPDGRLLASASDDGIIRVWDTATQVQVMTMPSSYGVVYAVAWSGDGARLVAGYSSGIVAVWDVATGAELISQETGGELVNAVAYAPDGSGFAAAGDDALIHIYDAETGAAVGILSGHESPIFGLEYSPDSRSLVSGSSDSTIRKWDLSTGQNVLRITGHSGTVWAVGASMDNRYIVSGSEDNTVRLWNMQTGEEVRRFVGHSGGIWDVTISADSRFIVSGSRDGSARLWDVTVEDTIAYVCSRLRREFTAAEREQFIIYDQQPTCPRFAPVAALAQPTATPLPSAQPTTTLLPAFATEIAAAAAADDMARDINRGARRVFGPESGALYHDPQSGSVIQNTAQITVADFVVQATVYVPYAGDWDFALFFRYNDTGHYRLITDSNATYSLVRYDTSGGLTGSLDSGTIPGWNVTEGSANTLMLIAVGDKADLYVNGEPVTRFDVGDRTSAGSVAIVTSATVGFERAGAATRYADFTVWSLDQVAVSGTPTPNWTPIPEYATQAAFAGTATVIAPTQIAAIRATDEAIRASMVPVFGPLDGALPHNVESGSVASQVALVDPTDFVVEARFFNPYGRSRGDWDIAYFFRGNTGGQYRLIVNSELQWQLRSNLEGVDYLTGGTLTNLNIGEGGWNTLRLVANGAHGSFYLNGEFISALDLSGNIAPGDLLIVAGANVGYAVTGERTRFEDFTVWVPAGTSMTPTPTPNVEQTARRGENPGELEIGSRDQWVYTARGGEIVDIYTAADWDTVLLLLAPDGQIAALNDDSVRGGLHSLIERYTFPLAGTYIIEVRGYDDAEGGAYALWITDPPVATPTPIPTATTPPTGEAQIGDNPGRIEVGGGDTWMFAGVAGQRLTLETLADWDTTLTVRRANGIVLVTNDDDPRGGTRASYIPEIVLPASETYTIEVRGYNDQFGGRYTLVISEGGG